MLVKRVGIAVEEEEAVEAVKVELAVSRFGLARGCRYLRNFI